MNNITRINVYFGYLSSRERMRCVVVCPMLTLVTLNEY